MSYVVDMDDIDKTGFDYVQSRALLKAKMIAHSNPDSFNITLGPNATSIIDNNWQENVQVTPKRIKIAQTKRLNLDKELPILNSPSQEEFMCAQKIMTQLDRLAVNEAQEAKFAFIKKYQEHVKKSDEQLAQFIAKEEAKWVKIEQQRVELLAAERKRMLEESSISIEGDSINSTLDSINIQAHPGTALLIEQQQKSEELSKRKLKFDQLFQNAHTFMMYFNTYLEKVGHEDLKTLRVVDLPLVKNINEEFNEMLRKCTKEGTIKQEDIEMTENYVQKIKNLLEKTDAELAKQEEIRNKKIQEKFEEDNRIQAEKEKQEKSSETEYTHLYESVHTYSNEVKEKLANFMTDDSFKKLRKEIQLAINVPVNGIAALDANHLNDKLRKIGALLQGQTVTVISKRITAGTHPLGVLYSMYFLATRIVEQGETIVSSKPELSFPIASLVIVLWTEFPDFGKLLLAHFYKVCPYLIPKYWTQEPNENEEAYNKKLGFLYSGGEREEMNKFLQRQGGVVRLYAAMMISSLKRSHSHLQHPFDISEAWRWTTSFTSLDPKPFISATLLLDMLEVTGYAMFTHYANQYRKLLHFICKHYLPKIEKVTDSGCKGTVVRLTRFLEGIVQGNRITPPKGVLPLDFW